MKKTLMAFGCIGFWIIGCEPSAQKQAEALQEEVMALHDSSMAHMGSLYSNRKTLKLLQGSLPAGDNAAQAALKKGEAQLLHADEQMMQWMRAYKAPNLQQPEEAKTYLQQEKKKILQVNQTIAASLKNADSLSTLYRKSVK